VKKVFQLSDGWTIKTNDGNVSAHFEHDVVVRKGRAEILSTFDFIDEVLKNKN
jgi:methionyl aminopeptidase